MFKNSPQQTLASLFPFLSVIDRKVCTGTDINGKTPYKNRHIIVLDFTTHSSNES